MIKISYAILTHDEGTYVYDLLDFLSKNKREIDEIVVVDDYSTDQLTVDTLNRFKDQGVIKLEHRIFDGDATQKNYLNSLCSGDFIVQLDADEIIEKEFMDLLPDLLESNPDADLYLVPRINTVAGLTEEDVKRWGWIVDDKGRVNFPDYQMRIYKNVPGLKWEGLLHSRMSGAKGVATLPTDDLFCILHHKKIERQREQNSLYDRIEKTGRTKYKV
jgi:glycosyltransferase involved in cell wall biosynthesis